MFSLLPKVDDVTAKAYLSGLEGTQSLTHASELWQKRPAFIFAIRRPGCVLCRYKAQEVWKQWRPQLEALGIHMVCVVHQSLPAEAKFFHEGFWPGDMFLDEDRVLYKLANGGKIRKGKLLSMLNPLNKVWKRIREASKHVKDHNLVGDGSVFGGFVVISRKGYIAFPERDFGEYASLEDVINAAKRVGN